MGTICTNDSNKRIIWQKELIIRNQVIWTLKASTLNNRAVRSTPGRATQAASTLEESPYHSAGALFLPAATSCPQVLRTVRLLRGDAFSVLCTSLRIIILENIKTRLMSSKPRYCKARQELPRRSIRSSLPYTTVLADTCRPTVERRIGVREPSIPLANSYARNCQDFVAFRLQVCAICVPSMKNGGSWKTIHQSQLMKFRCFHPNHQSQLMKLQKLTLFHQSRPMNLQDFRQPMGVATYKTADEMEPELLKALPPKEELQRVFLESSR